MGIGIPMADGAAVRSEPSLSGLVEPFLHRYDDLEERPVGIGDESRGFGPVLLQDLDHPRDTAVLTFRQMQFLEAVSQAFVATMFGNERLILYGLIGDAWIRPRKTQNLGMFDSECHPYRFRNRVVLVERRVDYGFFDGVEGIVEYADGFRAVLYLEDPFGDDRVSDMVQDI